MAVCVLYPSRCSCAAAQNFTKVRPLPTGQFLSTPLRLFLFVSTSACFLLPLIRQKKRRRRPYPPWSSTCCSCAHCLAHTNARTHMAGRRPQVNERPTKERRWGGGKQQEICLIRFAGAPRARTLLDFGRSQRIHSAKSCPSEQIEQPKE